MLARMTTLARPGTLLTLLLALGGCDAEPGPMSDAGDAGAAASDGGPGPLDGGFDGAVPSDDGGAAAPDGAVPACGEPDRVCPAAVPYSSAPCEGSLSCTYPTAEAQCVEGVWSAIRLCPDRPPGAPCLPPLVESCEAPFAGTLAGATVALGPYGAGRAFLPDEVVTPVVGGQGSPMISWALRIEGVEAPGCVRSALDFAFDGGAPVRLNQPVTLHCGASRATLLIVPGDVCDPMRTYPMTLHVTVEGVGEASATVRVQGIECLLTG
jgi:hypothetical protein